MKTWVCFLYLLTLTGCTACASIGCDCRHQTLREDYDGSPVATGPTIAKALADLGIDRESLVRVQLVGDEASYTAGVSTDFADMDTLGWVMDLMDRAEPYTFWYPSGYRVVKLFTSQGSEPAAILLVNESGACHVENKPGRYMCGQLGEWAISELKDSRSTKEGRTKAREADTKK